MSRFLRVFLPISAVIDSGLLFPVYKIGVEKQKWFIFKKNTYNSNYDERFDGKQDQRTFESLKVPEWISICIYKFL